MKSKVFALSLILLTPSILSAGDMSAEIASEHCFAETSKEPEKADEIDNKYAFAADGHQWLTFRVLLAATRDVRLSSSIAYYTQYPDIEPEYNALSVYRIVQKGWLDAIHFRLHALHGGDAAVIKARRENIERLLKKSLKAQI